MGKTETQSSAGTALDRIARLSAYKPDKEFCSLMHHINAGSLRDCYHKLDGKKAVGADGVSKAKYGEALDANLEELVSRMKRMAYRPGAVREIRIPKAGKPGATRSLGISNFEDKLVQKRMQELLEAIYDPLFIEHSYGFRRKRSCHDAIKAIKAHLDRHEVETVIDVDLANYFGSIDHNLLTEMLEKKIKDPRFIRYLRRMFKAGVLSGDELLVSEEGVVQGSCCSPVLANIFAHHVIDEWFNNVVKCHLKGRAELYRYADDIIILCQHASDAARIKEALGKRLAKYKLTLNADKTKLVSFSRAKYVQGERQQTFDFLGFTFYWDRSRKGRPLAKVKTSAERMRSKLKKLTQWIKEKRNSYRLMDLWKRYRIALQGHIRYYGVSFNVEAIRDFIHASERIMFKWLNRRSQKRSFNWEQFRLFLRQFPPPRARVYHKLY